jgi:hypothetical protein
MRLIHRAGNRVGQPFELRSGRDRVQDCLIGHGLELAWHAVEGFADEEWTVAPPAQGHRVVIAVVFGIRLVERTHSVASILAETSCDYFGLDQDVAGRTEDIKRFLLHRHYLVMRRLLPA